MSKRMVIWLFILGISGGCQALAARIGDELAPQIRTEVAVQVGTAVHGAGAGVRSTPTEPPATEDAQTRYDCVEKTCGQMESCDEAVYQLDVCGYSKRDRNGDGVPCESICTREQVNRIRAARAAAAQTGEIGAVARVIDGDTIDVLLDGVGTRIRYLQMNTPERDEPCFQESTDANAALVAGQTVRLVADEELVDPFGRLLRFVYVGDLLVNRALVEAGYAEVVLYPPNDARYDEFRALEQEAAAAGRGCHPTGVFADGTTTR